MLNKYLRRMLFMITALLVVGTAAAQKKTVKKKAVKTVRKYFGPPPPIVKDVVEAPPPPPSLSDSKQPGYAAPPMIMVSPQEAKFEKEKICTDCDTLVLEAGKPQIVIYDVKWMADRESRTYRSQPKAADLSTDYYSMRGLVKREWDELHQNFPESDVNYHHVYRNTFIKVANNDKQNLNLLDRQLRHEGFIYWSGKPEAEILQGNKMVKLTEQIGKAANVDKTSSYYASFKKDSLTVEKLMQTTRAAKDVEPNINAFLQQEILGEYIIPFQFINLKNVSSISLLPNGKEKLTFKFNQMGQLTEYIDEGDEHLIIKYSSNLPQTISRDGKIKTRLFYQDDVIITKDDYRLETFKMVGRLFLESDRYSIEKADYEEMKINSGQTYKIAARNSQTCLDYSDGDRNSSVCYSNNQFTLPLTMTESFGGDSQTKTFTMSDSGELVVENINKYKSSKMVYQLENGIIKAFQSVQKRGDDSYSTPNEIKVLYTFFK